MRTLQRSGNFLYKNVTIRFIEKTIAENSIRLLKQTLKDVEKLYRDIAGFHMS